ncbi:MAG: tyrosine recombinase XerC [Candidatus Tyrphobacter sp.]
MAKSADERLLEAFAAYLTLERNRSPLTVDAYLRDLRDFASWLGASRLRGATLSEIRKYVMYNAGEKRVDARTIRRRLSSIKTFYRYLKWSGERSDNPAAEVPGPRLPGRNPEHLQVSEVERLLATSVAGRTDFQRLRDRAILEVLYATGIRRAEVASIRIHDVDLASRTIEVTGKGNKRRTVLMGRAASAAVQAYLGVRPRTDDQSLFVGRHGRRLTPKHVWRIFRDIYDVSGLSKHATPHTLRHSFATHMVENDANLETVRELLGHEHLSTTGIYLKLAMEHKRRQYDEAHPRDRMLGGEGRRRTRK